MSAGGCQVDVEASEVGECVTHELQLGPFPPETDTLLTAAPNLALESPEGRLVSRFPHFTSCATLGKILYPF